MSRRAVAFLAGMLVSMAAVCAQDARPGQIREVIETRLGKVLDLQQKDGSFVLYRFRGTMPPSNPVGQTALAVVALQHARPHLKGALLDRVAEAVHKGVTFISSQPGERYTQSAGLVVCALVEEDPKKHEKLIKTYAGALVLGQNDRSDSRGRWGFYLKSPAEFSTSERREGQYFIDHQSTFFALLGLRQARRAGLSIPRKVWERTAEFYLASESSRGGWGEGRSKAALKDPELNATLAGLTNLVICRETLLGQRNSCGPSPACREIDAAVLWIAETWNKKADTARYEVLFMLSNLGLLTGRVDAGRHHLDGDSLVAMVLGRPEGLRQGRFGADTTACYEIILLSTALYPVAVGKLRRRDTLDWNNTPGDVRNLVRSIAEHTGQPLRWRLVDFDDPLSELRKIPILHISGHQALDFNFRENEKLKAYVMGGGTIVAQACCDRKAFDQSFRQFVQDVFGAKLSAIDKGHPLYERMKIGGLTPRPEIEVLPIKAQGGRLGIIYCPKGLCRAWHDDKPDAKEAFAAGIGIYLYVKGERDSLLAAADRRTPPAQPVPPDAKPPGPARAPVERDKEARLRAVKSAIADGVVRILAMQEENGAFALGDGPGGGKGPYPLGKTALAVLALQYARPWLDGEVRTRAAAAIGKGIAVIKQSRPEAKTYSAALILAVLFNDGPSKHRKFIDGYARMLVVSQRAKPRGFNVVPGMWGYDLSILGGPQHRGKPSREQWVDNSNTQFALLGLYYANRAGFQVPRVIWRRSRRHYLTTQFQNGGWGYKADMRATPYANMTMAGTVSLYICEEMLLPREQEQCAPPPGLEAVERGLKWIAGNWDSIGSDTYGLYALERLGIIMGRANIGVHDWYEKGAGTLVTDRQWKSFFRSGGGVPTCFGVIFLARGLDPIIINKLERRGTDDWNNTPYDVKHLVEHIQDHHQQAVQWRIVTLEAPLALLLETPILHISGHETLDFNDAEKAKLKAYVAGGGTILAQACCSRKAFDESFRALVKEVFGGELQTLPKTHRIYERMQLKDKTLMPKIEVMRLDRQRGRPSIIYLPNGIARNWHLGGKRANPYYAVGTGIYFHVTKP